MYHRDLGLMIIKSIIAVALLTTIIYLMAIDRLFGIVVILGIVAGIFMAEAFTSLRVSLVKKMHRPTPSFKKHTVPPGLMHQQARGKTRRSRVQGPPFRWR